MSNTDPPSFEEATVYVVLPAHLSLEEAEKLAKAVEAALPEGTPALAVKARGEDEPADGEVRSMIGPAALMPILRPIVVAVGKKIVDGVATVVRDNYKDEREAKKAYDDSARRYNEEREKWWRERNRV